MKTMTELIEINAHRVDLVDKAAGGTEFIILKAAGDEDNQLISTDMVRKIAEEPAVADATTDVTKADGDDLDVTETLADAGADATANDPGSESWEEVDAATGMKWAAIAARLANALDVLAGREMAEAANGSDDGIENSWDLQDAQQAVEFAQDVLGAYATGETADAALAAEIGKALNQLDPTSLDIVEASGAALAKAGRVLSAANESLLATAAENIQKVLASLPTAPEADDVAKTEKETPVDEVAKTEPVEKRDDNDNADSTTPAEVDASADIEKAKGDPTLIVYNSSGLAVGTVDPANVSPIATPPVAPDAEKPVDTTPEPAAEVGTPADAPAPAAPAPAVPAQPVAKSEAEPIEKSVSDIVKEAIAESEAKLREESAALVKSLQDEVEVLKAQPATPKVRSMVPADLRGMDVFSGQPTDASKLAEVKDHLMKSQDAPVREAAAAAFNAAAMQELMRVHSVPGQPILTQQ